MSTDFYRAFEDRYRGSREMIKERLSVYLPFLKALTGSDEGSKALDIGCGRGEWLEILLENGFSARGIDLDEGMLQVCSALGLPAEQGDGLEVLGSLPDDSLSVISGFHVAEHISFDLLLDLVSNAFRVLRPGGLLILETPNAENLVVGANNFYLDPSHERPIPALLMRFIVEYTGFSRNKLLRLNEPKRIPEPLSLLGVLDGTSPDYAIVAQKSGGGDLSAFDAINESGYGNSLNEMAKLYEHGLVQRFETQSGRIDQQSARLDQQSERIDQAVGLIHEQNRRIEGLMQGVNVLELRLSGSLALMEQQAERLNCAHEANRAQWQAQLVEAQQRLAAVQQRLNQSASQAEQLRQRIVNQDAQLRDFLASTSWRITRPLRGLSRAMGGLRRLPELNAVAAAPGGGMAVPVVRPEANNSKGKAVSAAVVPASDTGDYAVIRARIERTIHKASVLRIKKKG